MKTKRLIKLINFIMENKRMLTNNLILIDLFLALLLEFIISRYVFLKHPLYYELSKQKMYKLNNIFILKYEDCSENISLFLLVSIFFPFKYCPPLSSHFCSRCFQITKQSWKPSFEMSYNVFDKFVSMSSMAFRH